MSLKDYRQNVPKSYATSFLRMMMFAVPVITIFLLSNGLSMTQILLLESYFSFVLILLEVPSGALADMIGRKHLLAIGSFILAIASIVYSIGHNFYDFMVAESIWALGSSMISGADIAIIYDTMKKIKSAGKIKSVLSNFHFFAMVGGITGSLVSGFIVLNDPTYRWALALSAVPFLVAALISFTLKEPELYQKQKFSVRKYYMGVFSSVAKIRKNRRLLFLFINFAFIAAFGRIGFWFFQPYMKVSGIDVAYFGLVFMVFTIFAALSAKMAPVFDKILGKKKSVIAFSLLQGLSLFGMSLFVNPAAAILLIIAMEFVWGASYPLFLSYIHKHIKSKERATLDSVGSTLANIVFSFFSPIFGFISDAYSMQTVFAILGAIIIAQMVLFRVEES